MMMSTSLRNKLSLLAGLSCLAGCGGELSGRKQAIERSTGKSVEVYNRSTRASTPESDAFHSLYYNVDTTWKNTFWQGVQILKNPLDMWIYQEMLHALRPDLIVETGTARGGSALYMAQLCDLADRGSIITIDIAGDTTTQSWRDSRTQGCEGRPAHPRITYLTGSSTAPDIFAQAKEAAAAAATVMVILDSDHSMQHVLAELRLYADLVSPGSYLIVEDTNVNGNPVVDDFGPGPMEAVEAFLQERSDFVVDAKMEKFMFSFNPSGYLKKVE